MPPETWAVSTLIPTKGTINMIMFILGMDTDVLLNDLNEIQWDVNIFHEDGQIQTIQGIDANLPQASAYIFSVVPPGPLPKQFWQDKQYSSTDQQQFCSVFKVNTFSY